MIAVLLSALTFTVPSEIILEVVGQEARSDGVEVVWVYDGPAPPQNDAFVLTWNPAYWIEDEPEMVNSLASEFRDDFFAENSFGSLEGSQSMRLGAQNESYVIPVRDGLRYIVKLCTVGDSVDSECASREVVAPQTTPVALEDHQRAMRQARVYLNAWEAIADVALIRLYGAEMAQRAMVDEYADRWITVFDIRVYDFFLFMNVLIFCYSIYYSYINRKAYRMAKEYLKNHESFDAQLQALIKENMELKIQAQIGGLVGNAKSQILN